MISCKEPSTASSVSHYAIYYLEKYDYLKELKTDEHHLSEAIRKALLKFQRLYLLKESGSDDDETIKAMIRPRCANKDFDYLVDLKDEQVFGKKEYWKEHRSEMGEQTIDLQSD